MSEDPTPTENAPPRERSAQSVAPLLGAVAAVTGVLALVLFPIFAWLGLTAAPYWAVGVAFVGGVVMRRGLLRAPSMLQTLLFTVVTIGGALAGLWLANLLLS